jgi:tetratricopeptide (TPR) repeat protein
VTGILEKGMDEQKEQAMKAAHPHPLRLARCQRNLTINQLAEETRVGASTIWRAEHAYPISAESRRRLCLFFNQTSQELGLINDRREKSDVPTDPLPGAGASPSQSAAHSVVVVTDDADAPPLPSIAYHPASDASLADASASMLLAQTSSDLAALLDAGWSLTGVLTALRTVLPGVQGLPPEARRSLSELSGADRQRDDSALSGEHLSQEDRARLCNGLRRSVMESWRLYQSAPPAYVLVVARTQLALVQQASAFLPADLRASLYAGLYNLIGAALLHLGQYAAARRTHEKAHIAALEGADVWNMAQSLNWQAIGANNTGHYAEAIQYIEAALRLPGYAESGVYLRLEAHLLADWAFNAALLHQQTSVQEKLERSATLLEGLGPDEEFDLSRWHQTAGTCMLLSQNYPAAIAHLERSLAALAPQWLVRQVLTLAPLGEAYARQRERDASIATGEQIARILQTMDSALLNRCFLELQQQMLKAFPRDRRVRGFIERAQRQPLLHAIHADQRRPIGD